MVRCPPDVRCVSSAFCLLPSGQLPGPRWEDPRIATVRGYRELTERFAGCTFENGLYRLHDKESGPVAEIMIAEAFPHFAARALAFGYDWLGRQLAFDPERVEAGEPLVLLFEPGTGQVLEVPLSFEAFHEELPQMSEPVLASSFFAEWTRANPTTVPIARTDCVGYRVPLFLGGSDQIENLAVTDLAVYWSLCGQLRRGTGSVPAGTQIREVNIDDS
jgi:hypothetical protein